MTDLPAIDLLRHGETDGGMRYRGSTDDVLTAAGWEQMWTAVGAECRWDGVVSSPLRRCAQFARALAQRHALSVRIDDRMRELNFGAWEGRSAAEIMQTDAEALTRFWQDPSNHGPTGGESLSHLQARVLAAWQDVIAEGRSILVVTHGGPIRTILCHVRGYPLEQLFQIDVAPASLWRLPIPLALAEAVSAR